MAARPFRCRDEGDGQEGEASRIYRDSLDDDVEILGTTQGSGAPKILQSDVLSRTPKIAVAASSTRRYSAG